MRDLAERFDLGWELTYSDVRPRVAVFASKAPHCLYDLLLAHQLGELGGDLVVVVSNHETLRSVAGHFGVPFEYIPVGAADKAAAEARQQQLLGERQIDLVVLARYMQILSPEFVARWPARIINIHHSFLPAFVGAKPYHQAKERGVKVIGATAHYVTSDLDQGPIIEQDVAPRHPPRRRRRAGPQRRRAGTPRADPRRAPAPGAARAGLREPNHRLRVRRFHTPADSALADNQRISPKPAMSRASSISKRQKAKSFSARYCAAWGQRAR